MDDKQNKIEKQASPAFASVNWKPEDDTFEDRKKWFGFFLKLRKEIRYGLVDNRTKEFVLNLAREFGFSSDYEKIGEISRIIRESFFQVEKEVFLIRIEKRLGLDRSRAENFLEKIAQIKNQIISIGKEEYQKSFEYLNLEEVSKKNPEILEQVISYFPINLEIYDGPVRASIKNWLEDYKEKMGSGAHSAMQRNNYLFESENAKRLSYEERQKLSQIINSLEDGEKLKIDINQEEVEFDLKNNIQEEEKYVFKKENQRKVFQNKNQSQTIQNQNDPNRVDLRAIHAEKEKNKQSQNKNILDLSQY